MRKFLLYILFASYSSFSQDTEITLNTSWQFRQKGTENWLAAIVPGNVHTDLLKNEKIPDPFYGDNEKKVQWIENEDWEYKTEFTCDKKILSQNNIELRFEGLDTYAKVYLNKMLILESNNMFRSWTVSVKSKLKEGSNTLSVIFESAVKKGKAEAEKLPYTLPGDEKIFTRKAQYQYGWDWAPRFVTCGIHKPIKLITWDKVKIESIHANTKSISDSSATVDFVIETNCTTEGNYNVKYTFTDRKLMQNKIQNQIIVLKSGLSTHTITCKIPNPKLWWCNGLNNGRSSLYTAGFKITKNDSIVCQEGVTFGIRTIELIREKDSLGFSFYFKLNGAPIFIKGANYIPQNSFLPNIRKDDYRKLLTLVKESNMNTLRVWGGGTYADEELYKDCDKAGILVWQDFMFACAMYPGDKAFIENVKQEATEQVKKLRNHPCLALWCGNNEIDEGWNNWGWQKQYKYSKTDSTKIWNDYRNLFHEILPTIVKQNDAKTAYWPSSPSIGWGHKESLLEGDSHYWGVWWGNEPFENYEKKVGRFMSEYGFQSMPSLQTFKLFCDSVDLNLNSASVKNHQKHPKGFETIKTYMERDYTIPKEFEKFIYVSQLVQARGMGIAIEAHRRNKPHCMGTLFWQLNDCWPVTSWSAIDFHNRPKALFYDLKNLYADVLISIKKEKDDYKVYIVNDKSRTIKGHLSITIKDFGGRDLFKVKMDTLITQNSSLVYFAINKIQLNESDFDKTYICSEFTSIDKTIKAKSLFYFDLPKNLKLDPAKPSFVFNASDNSVTIKSNTLIKNIFIESSTTDNFFDVEPDIEYKIKLNAPLNKATELKFLSLNKIND